MKKTSILLLINGIFIHSMFSQVLVQRIDDSYAMLDSVFYIESVIDVFKEQVSKEVYDMSDVLLEIRGVDCNELDTLHKQNIVDSFMGKKGYSRAAIEERTNRFATNIRKKSAHYVLNLNIDTCTNGQVCLQPDTSCLLFNLFYFDNRSNSSFFVLFENGQISHYDSKYRTFSELIGRNNKKVFRQILRKNPKYLLYSYDLEQMNTILYLLDDKVYVYRISQMEEYELDDYISKFVGLESNRHISDSTNTFIE